MITGTQVTVIGNLGADPEMRYTPGGNAVTTFTVAVPQRRKDQATGKWEDTGTTWWRCVAWRYLAEHAAETLTRGMRVIVIGPVATREWEDKEGNKQVTWEVTCDEIGPALSFATATVKRAERDTAPIPDDPYTETQ